MRHFKIAFVIVATMLGCIAAAQSNSSLPLKLPVAFEGITPCADCPGIRIVLKLRADHSYSLRREYLERSAKFSEAGAWSYDSANSRLTLHPKDKSNPEYFSLSTAPTLRMLDTQGKPIQSGLNFTLAEAPLEKTNDSLGSATWELVELAGKAFKPASKEAEVTLAFDIAEKRVSGSSGCNRLTGSFEAADGKLRFGQLASTRMMCAPDIMQTETAFLKAMEDVASYKIEAESLDLYSANGSLLAKLAAVK